MYAPRHSGKEGGNNRGCGKTAARRDAAPEGAVCDDGKGLASGCGSWCRGAGRRGLLISPRHLAQFVLRYWVHGGCAMCVGLGPLWTTGGFPVPLPPGDPFGFPPPRDMPSFGNASATEPNRSVATAIADTIANFLFISRLLHRYTEKARSAGHDIPPGRDRFISKALPSCPSLPVTLLSREGRVRFISPGVLDWAAEGTRRLFEPTAPHALQPRLSSYFNPCFRKRYGQTPSDVRATSKRQRVERGQAQ
jgi:hypothetical protein